MRTLIDTTYGRASEFEKGANQALRFLLTNRRTSELDGRDMSVVTHLRGTGSTAVQQVFDRMVSEGLMKHFLSFNFTDIKTEVPVLLAHDEFTLDGSWLNNAPDSLHGVWVNTTPTLSSRRGPDGAVSVSNPSRLMGYYVRGLLCAGYANHEVWLSPTVAPFVIETFSAACAIRLGTSFNLDAQTTLLLQTAFAYHYAKCVSIEDVMRDPKSIPPILNRCGFLGSNNDMVGRLEMLADTQDGKGLYHNGLVSVCDALALGGPERMRKFSAPMFYKLFSIGNVDNASLSISMDYPPYWVFLLLKQASGSKSAMMSLLMRRDSLRRRLEPWIRTFMNQRTLTEWRD